MTDEYEQTFDPIERQYVPPLLRVAAVYQATDGRVPESIDVEINHLDVAEIGAAVASVVATLARVADARMTFAAGGLIGGSTRDHVYLGSGSLPGDIADAAARTVAGAGTGAAR